MTDLLELGNSLAMLYSFSFLVFAIVRFQVLSRPLLSLIIPITIFTAFHGSYHMLKFLGYEELPGFVELTSVVVVLILAVQLSKERL